MSETILRFAPSPTGGFHVGNAATAIFNDLYAQKYGARLLLRIEDTDRNRISPEALETILEGLSWLDIEFEGDPVFQSDNGEVHRKVVQQLLETGHAYYSYETPEELKELQRQAQIERRRVRYNRELTPEQQSAFEAEGRPKAVRFKVPPGETTWDDLVRGVQRWDNQEIEDFVIQRADGSPIYHLAVIVDDHNMGVTLAIRSADHLSNTPKQILLFKALGWEVPGYGHATLVLGDDGKKLSKRHGSTTVTEYLDQGYLPEALYNFLAFFSWSPGEDNEVFTREELAKIFSLEGVLRKDAIFDEKKLAWLNGEHLRAKPLEDLVDPAVAIWVEEGWVSPDEVESRKAELSSIVGLFQERVRTIQDFRGAEYCFNDPTEYDERTQKKNWKADTPDRLQSLLRGLEALDEFTEGEIERITRTLAGELGLSASRFIHPTRLALSGVGFGPGLFELMEVLGRETCIRRLNTALNVLTPIS